MSEIHDLARAVIAAGEKIRLPWQVASYSDTKFPYIAFAADKDLLVFQPSSNLASSWAQTKYACLAANHAPALAEQVLADAERIAALRREVNKIEKNFLQDHISKNERIAELEAEVKRLTDLLWRDAR
jgi:hypothetical protein